MPKAIMTVFLLLTTSMIQVIAGTMAIATYKENKTKEDKKKGTKA